VGRTLLFLLFAGLQATAADPDFDPAALRDRVRMLRPIVEDILGQSLGVPVSVAVVTPEALEPIVNAEMVPPLGDGRGDPVSEDLHRARVRDAKLVARYLLGKVDPASGRLLLCPKNFERVAALDPAWRNVSSQEFLDAVLLRGLVHVYHQRRFGPHRFLGPLDYSQGFLARQCVLEGHAQFVTRRAVRRAGLDDAFRLFVATQIEVPPGIEDADTRRAMEAVRAHATATHIGGETFVGTVVEELGYAEAVQRIFTEPPTSLELVASPGDYLSPPAVAADLNRIAARIRRLLAERGKRTEILAMTKGTVRAALAPAGEAAVTLAMRGFRAAKVVVVEQRKADVPLAVVSILACADARAAQAMYAAEVSTSKNKDELYRGEQSPTRILSARYDELRVGGALGVLGTKEVEITQLGVRQTVEFAVLRDRELVFEIMYNVDPSETGRCRRLARRVQALARARPWGAKGAEAIAAFVVALDDDAWGTRWRAARNLARSRRQEPAIEPALRRALEDGDPAVRLAAFVGLAARFRLTPAERAAFDGDEDWEVRVASLETPAEDHVARLQRALEDPHAAVRRTAFALLTELGEADVISWERLRSGIRDGNAGVRLAALLALTPERIAGKLDRTEFAALMLAALRDPHPHVRREAAELSRHADPTVNGVVPGVAAALHDDAFVVRLAAVMSLAEFGGLAAPAVPDLVRLLDDAALRINAARTLGRIGPPAKEAALPGLAEALEQRDRAYRFEAALALRRIGHPEEKLLPVFVDGLRRAKSEHHRALAAEFLADVGAHARVPDLIEALDDPSDWVRRTVVEALAKLDAREALPKLRRLTKDPSEAVQAAARKAVRAMETEARER
jgi:HEAT repeat protein